MSKKSPPASQTLLLEDTLINPKFALASAVDPVSGLPTANVDFETLIANLGVLPGGPYDYAYIGPKAASAPGKISVGTSLEALNGIITTGNGKNDIDISNSTGNNLVFSGNGNDKIKGGEGADMLFGQNGKDELEGGNGNDVLDGGNGRDTLRGGDDAGTFSNATELSIVAGDVLSGGNGPDFFYYELGDGVDQITDFKVGADTLVLEGVTLDQVLTATDGTNLYIGFNDGAGGWVADQVIEIMGVTDINALFNGNDIIVA